jgi:hypothetical protein
MGSVPAFSATAIVASPSSGSTLCSVATGPGAFACSYVAYFTGANETISSPAVPATTVAVENTNTFQVTVVVTGATVTAVVVNGVTVAGAAGTVVVPAGGSISLTYPSGTPTWVWSAPQQPLTADQDNIALQSDPVTASTFVTADVLLQQPILNAPLVISHYVVYAQTTIKLVAVTSATTGVSYHVQLNAVYPGPSGAFL